MTQLQLNCFKLDGFIIYIKVSFVTNQYCCLIFLPGWSGCDQSKQTLQSGWKKRGKCSFFQLGIRCRMMSAGGGSGDGSVLLLDELSVCSSCIACFSSSPSTLCPIAGWQCGRSPPGSTKTSQGCDSAHLDRIAHPRLLSLCPPALSLSRCARVSLGAHCPLPARSRGPGAGRAPGGGRRAVT